jgi:2-keto-4-pentenoate hydratase/2-oxohepta-3-ene-1,7-dioic acid hydratase in catechol pathway
MRIARIRKGNGRTTHAVIEGAFAEPIDGDIFGAWARAGKAIPLDEVKLLAPIVPPNMLCFGLTYRDHVEETEESLTKSPIFFIKATTCVNDPDEPIIVPSLAPSEVDYESELAVIIGRAARNVSREEALKYVFGYTCANDVSARDVQHVDSQWARGKSLDTFGPLGPWIETELDPRDLRIRGRLNGRVVQDSSTSLLRFDVAWLVSYISRDMTLPPGTVLLTGTPAGCGFAQNPPRWLAPGDVFEVEIEGIGILRNPIVKY